jgi:hypothetical protein
MLRETLEWPTKYATVFVFTLILGRGRWRLVDYRDLIA